jgi:hypothetical protein
MAAAHHASHHQQQRFVPPEHYDRRLPSIKDLNFPLRQQEAPGAGSDSSAEQSSHNTNTPQEQPRHTHLWSRNSSRPAMASPVQMHHPLHHPHPSQGLPQQQHTPPLSAGHEHLGPKVAEYTSKHTQGNYYAPVPPVSGQVTPVPNPVNASAGPRSDEPPQPKRARHSDSNGSISGARERPPHVSRCAVLTI